jgi:hypothetical protein
MSLFLAPSLKSQDRPSGPSFKERRRSRQRGNQLRSLAVWIVLGTATLGVFGFLVFNALRPATGEPVEVVSRDHVSEPTPPGPFNTDPPTSGAHYQDTLPAGFYDEAEVESLPAHPEGYLVHNLEHDYTIVWYNCGRLAGQDCERLKEEIRQALDAMSPSKLIAFPWPSQAEAVVLTHWGRILRLDEFNARTLATFHRSNLGRAPEPNAP